MARRFCLVARNAKRKGRIQRLKRRFAVQLLVYVFISIVALACGSAVYFGLTFTLVESLLVAGIVFSVSMLLMERTLRRRSERRMEKAIEDLSRLLSTDAQAGQVLSQRINALTDVNPGPRIDVLEADLSVLGTVVRQVAEAVSEIESRTAAVAPPAPSPAVAVDHEPEHNPEPTTPRAPEPVIPIPMLRTALEEERLVFHAQPVITLPQRRTHGFDLVPRLRLEDGDLADAPDFMPRRNGQDVIRRIERAGIEEAVSIVRRARSSGQPVTLFIPVSRAILSHKQTAEDLIGLFDASRVVSSSLVLRIDEAEWKAASNPERIVASEYYAKGIGFCLSSTSTLRLDFDELAGLGVGSIRVDAETFASEPAILTDFHVADVSSYIARFGIDLTVENVRTEQQVLSALEDGVRFAVGPHIAGPAPLRIDHMVRRDATTPVRRAGSA